MPPLENDTARFLQAWMGVRQIVQAANFNQFHRAGLSATQFMIINVIPARGINLSELAHRLNLSPATLSQTVDSLEERGLVLRRKNEQDARRFDIFATADGEKMQNAASGYFHRTMSRLFSKMNAGDRSALISGLEQLVQISQVSESSNEERAIGRIDAAPRVGRNSKRRRLK